MKKGKEKKEKLHWTGITYITTCVYCRLHLYTPPLLTHYTTLQPPSNLMTHTLGTSDTISSNCLKFLSPAIINIAGAIFTYVRYDFAIQIVLFLLLLFFIIIFFYYFFLLFFFIIFFFKKIIFNIYIQLLSHEKTHLFFPNLCILD